MLTITLARQDFREFDQLITLYTLEQGKIETVARGIKKNIAKNAPALEPFSLIEVELAPGRELTYITKAIIVEQYTRIRTNLTSMFVSGAALSLVQRLVGVGEKDVAIFNLLVQLLQFLDSTKQPTTILLGSFTVRLAGMIGFIPVLDRCVRCNKKRTSSSKCLFGIDLGGIVCSDCRKVEVNSTLVPLTASVATFLEQLQQNDWERILTIQVEPKMQKVVEKLIKNFMLYHTSQLVPFATLSKLALV